VKEVRSLSEKRKAAAALALIVHGAFWLAIIKMITKYCTYSMSLSIVIGRVTFFFKKAADFPLRSKKWVSFFRMATLLFIANKVIPLARARQMKKRKQSFDLIQ